MTFLLKTATQHTQNKTSNGSIAHYMQIIILSYLARWWKGKQEEEDGKT